MMSYNNLRSYLSGIIFFSCIACGSKQNLKKNLTGNCFWDIHDPMISGSVNSCYKFEANGDCYYLYYNFYNKKRTDSVSRYDNGDVVVPNKWYIDDDSLKIRGLTYNIEKIADDSLFLLGNNNQKLILVKNCATHWNR